MSVLMSPEFLLTSLIVVASPGTGVIYTLGAGLGRGARAATIAAFGCTLGILPHLLAAVLGLSEASVSRIGEEQLFYLQSRGLTEAEASSMIVSGFIEPLVKELPMEYAVEMNRLIELQMEGSVG